MLEAILLLLLALLGLANAVYFTLIYYRVISPNSGVMPAFCRVGEHVCEAVVFTRYGRLFYVPNSLLGIVFYLGVIGVALSRLVTGRYRFVEIVLPAALLTIPVGVYLIYALRVRLKAP